MNFKRIVVMLLVMLIVIIPIGCSKKTSQSKKGTERTGEDVNENTEIAVESKNTKKENKTKEISYEDMTLEGILNEINEDFDNTIQHLSDEFDAVNAELSGSYDEYVENKELLTEWYGLVMHESEELFVRAKEKSKLYYELIVLNIEHDDSDAIDDAMENYYDEVYDGAFEKYYDDVYDGLLDDAYDLYYDGVIDDAYDTVDYDEWSDVSDESYEEWSDANDDVYDLWSDVSDDIYECWSDVDSEFWDEEFDITDILEELIS